MIISPMLKAALFALICGIMGFMLYILILWAQAFALAGAWVFTLVAGSGSGG